MPQIHVIGIGLEGAQGLTMATLALIEKAKILIGSPRHLAYFPDHPAQKIILKNSSVPIDRLQEVLQNPKYIIVILTSGDPLFFGLGRLLLQQLPPEYLTFHPHLTSVQLAFSRLKLPWQDAEVISVHGRSWERLIQALREGRDKLAILTDPEHSPSAIAQLLQDLDLCHPYHAWICENLGGDAETIHQGSPEQFLGQQFTSLSIMVLVRSPELAPLNLAQVPQIGIPDSLFLSFDDRPGLMTKREIRTLILAELSLQPGQIVWDIGAGTGSVAIEIARLCPTSRVYAVEKTVAGQGLIPQNCQRLAVTNVTLVKGQAPDCLDGLPRPDRIFIGGSGGYLAEILKFCAQVLSPFTVGVVSKEPQTFVKVQAQTPEILTTLHSPATDQPDPLPKYLVLALATLEHLAIVQTWAREEAVGIQLRQVQVSRSIGVAGLTRYVPLNPVVIVTIPFCP